MCFYESFSSVCKPVSCFAMDGRHSRSDFDRRRCHVSKRLENQTIPEQRHCHRPNYLPDQVRLQRCQPPKFKIREIFVGLKLLLCRPLKCSDRVFMSPMLPIIIL